jgi:hypothetical protein
MNKRKIILGAVSFACVLVIFGIYNLMVDTEKITLDDQDIDKGAVELPNFDENSGQIGTAKLADVGQSKYITRDPETKQIKRILGFERLEDPTKGSDIWNLEKPYMKLFGDNYECNIQSDRGKVRVETVLGDASPSMAELNDNVEIVIHTKKDNRKIYVSLDDLIYDSERCEFTSDGPVKVEGSDGVMEGTGLIMIYDAQLGKLAYLEILKLDYLTIKNAVKTDKEQTEITAETEIAKPDQSAVADSTQPVKQQQTSEAAAAKTTETTEDEKYKYYQCRLLDNVNIEYGKKLVIVGADDVTISNILWSSSKSDDASSEKDTAGPALVASDTSPTEAVKPVAKAKIAQMPDEAEDVPGSKDVYVTCNGPLIIRPMELAGIRPNRLTKSNTRRMGFVGRPVRIGQLIDRNSEDIEPIASCGAMTYDLDRQVLDLITNETERYVELNMTDNQANIYTAGSVKWNRRDNNAVITGPGMLLVDETATGGNTSDMKFDGKMNIYFADKSPQSFNQQLSLSSVNLVGGMTANINKNGNAAVKSDIADIQFERGKQIARIDLNGSVDMASDTGSLKSDDATIFFAKDDSGKNVPIKMTASGKAVMQPKQIASQRPTRFHAKKIDYDMLTGSAVASGPVDFYFYMPDDKDTPASDQEKVPVIITAEDNAKFYPEDNQFVFNGNVVGRKLVHYPEFVQADQFTGDQLIVDIAPSKADETKDDISHVRIVGGLVKLRSTRTANKVISDDTGKSLLKKTEKVVIGDVGLSCMQIDWDAATQVILAKGPGEIEINNKNAPEQAQTETEDRSFALAGPCVAYIDGFQTLNWDTLNQTMFADGGTGDVNIGYLPYKNGRRGQVIRAASSYITSRFVETSEGKFDLATLDAKDGITYEEDKVHIMMGDSMHYDASDGIMVIKSAPGEDCIVDGARMPQVEYNMKTGRIKSELSSRPGTLKVQ